MHSIIYLIVAIEDTTQRSETCQTKGSAVLEKTSPAFILALSEESVEVTTGSSTTTHCCYLCCGR